MPLAMARPLNSTTSAPVPSKRQVEITTNLLLALQRRLGVAEVALSAKADGHTIEAQALESLPAIIEHVLHTQRGLLEVDAKVARTREVLAQAFEAMGELSKAREARLHGMPHMIRCAYLKCPAWSRLFNRDDLYQCSRCKGPRYCSEHCQRADWAPRHTLYCRNPDVP